MGLNLRDAWNSFGEDPEEKEAKASDISWSNIKEDIVGIRKEEKIKAVEIYEEMARIAEGDPSAKSLFNDVVDALLRYLSTMDALSRKVMETKTGEASVDDREASDKSRSAAHDSLISCLNIYSRYCAKAGFDNSWRRVLGLNRIQVTKWTLAVAEHVHEKTLN